MATQKSSNEEPNLAEIARINAIYELIGRNYNTVILYKKFQQIIVISSVNTFEILHIQIPHLSLKTKILTSAWDTPQLGNKVVQVSLWLTYPWLKLVIQSHFSLNLLSHFEQQKSPKQSVLFGSKWPRSVFVK